MELNFFRGEKITIIRRNFESEETIYGTYKQTFTEIEAEAVVGLSGSYTEKSLKQQVENTTVSLTFNSGTEIFPDDTFVVRGTLWEKDSNALDLTPNFPTSTFLPPPVKVILKQSKGNVGQEPNSQENRSEEVFDEI